MVPLGGGQNHSLTCFHITPQNYAVRKLKCHRTVVHSVLFLFAHTLVQGKAGGILASQGRMRK